MKKVLRTLAVVMTIAIFGVMVMGSGSDSSSSSSTTAAVSETMATVQPNEKAEETEAAKEAETTTEATTEAPTEAAKGAIDFPATVLVDNDSIYFEVKSIEWDSIWGYTLKCICENKTDKELMFSARDGYVNGWQCDPLWASTVAAGKKSNESLSFSKDKLEECGIDEITNITFVLHVYDSNDWLADPVEDNEYTIYPLGEDADKEYKREAQATDEVLVDNDNVTITITNKSIDKIWGYKLEVFLENKTDKHLMFSVHDASVNGFMCDPFFASSLKGGKKAMVSITWGESTLAEQGLTPETVEELEIPFKVYDENNFMADPVLEETYTVKAK